MTTITAIDPHCFQIDLGTVTLFFNTDDCDPDLAARQYAEVQRFIARAALPGTIDTITEATEIAAKISAAVTYPEALVIFDDHYKRITIRTGQDILLRGITGRADHPSRWQR